MTLQPAWFTEGARHVWRPYCQMKTAPPPLPVARTDGARIILEDGREPKRLAVRLSRVVCRGPQPRNSQCLLT